MSIDRNVIWTAGAVLIAAAACTREQTIVVESVNAGSVDNEPTPDLTTYQRWHRVNDIPYLLDFIVFQGCASANTVFYGHHHFFDDEDSPSFDVEVDDRQTRLLILKPLRLPYIHVFVNEIARPAMYQKNEPRFPIGSIIVKEKWHSDRDAAPTLLTVMMKRESGFNPETGDWEYFTFDGAGTQMTSRGRIESCMECHIAKPNTDFVFRPYVNFDPAPTWGIADSE